MKNANAISTEQYSDFLSEESSTQMIVRPFHIITTAVLLVAWVLLGTVLLG
jgi:hypothetical protein